MFHHYQSSPYKHRTESEPPTEKQTRYARYLATSYHLNLPRRYTKQSYWYFIKTTLEKYGKPKKPHVFKDDMEAWCDGDLWSGFY